MKEADWNKMRIPAHIRNVMTQYSRIKRAFLNEKKINEFYDDPAVISGIEKMLEELLKLNSKLEKYEKDTGLSTVKL